MLAGLTPSYTAGRYALGCSCLLMIGSVGLLMGIATGLGVVGALVENPVITLAAAFYAVGLAVPFLLVILWLDRNEPEPAWLLASAFAWGAVMATGLSILVNDLFSAMSYAYLVSDQQVVRQIVIGVVAPFVEELTKGAALLALFLFFRREFDNILDGIVYGAMVGLGFAVFENFAYYARCETVEDLQRLAFLRGVVTAAGTHVCFTAMTGIGMGMFRVLRRGRRRFVYPALTLLLAMGSHSLWNVWSGHFLVPVDARDWTELLVAVPIAVPLLQSPFVAFVVLLAFVSLRQEVEIIQKYLKDESPEVLLPGELDRIVPPRRRLFQALELLAAFRFHELAVARRRSTLLVRLAFEKWHMDEEAIGQTLFHAREHALRVKRLRAELRGLRVVY